LKVYCKRTKFETNTNNFLVNGKAYGESYTLWEKSKVYNARPANEWEKHLGILYYIDTERVGWVSPIKVKDFEKYFTLQSTHRDNLLDKLIPPV
jgi:hypothetical protein